MTRRAATLAVMLFLAKTLFAQTTRYDYGGAGASGTWTQGPRMLGNMIQYSGRVGSARSYGHSGYIQNPVTP